MDASTRNTFISLVRLGIGHNETVISQPIDWDAVFSLASKQGLAAIVFDGAFSTKQKNSPAIGTTIDPDIKRQWMASVVFNYEKRYKAYSKAISSLAGLFHNHGLKTMLLKGYACSLNYPIPSHRPCGDIDIWLFGRSKDGDKIIETKTGKKVDNSHHHHTVFYWKGFMVENHYDFINIYYRKSNIELEKIFKELGKDDSYSIEIEGKKVYLPSPNLNALFLLRHTMAHFAATEISLRNLLDWAFFVKAHFKVIDWAWLQDVLKRFGMEEIFSIFNAICIEDLGFDADIFPTIQCDAEVKERVFSDILSPEFKGEEPSNLFPRIAFKYHRWKANAWKHKLCYKESMLSAFLSGVWLRILKPSSI